MCIASQENNMEAMQWLFAHGADVRTPGKSGMTPMYSASYNGHLRLVQFLHENGAAQDVNEKSWHQETPLWRACKENQLDIIQWLIRQGTPLKTTVASWFNQLNYENRMILYQQGLRNRDVDHESYLAFLTCVDHDIGDNPAGVRVLHIRGIQEIIGEFVRGSKETSSLWYHIVQQGPGDESEDDEEEEEDDGTT
jgi:ankyrin repeat protein